MDEFGCDYTCKTVGESIEKYQIPNDWCAEFDSWDDICPVICIQVSKIREMSAVMDLKLRMIDDPDVEYAGCIVLTERKTIMFKIDNIGALINAMEKADA